MTTEPADAPQPRPAAERTARHHDNAAGSCHASVTRDDDELQRHESTARTAAGDVTALAEGMTLG
ncbi:hypothetical protein [Streptomyces sp. NPDC020817]|uniref:hypothetical protein n=1 Tax=Streptomyces sp. NPDC020817 TaxID=3365095 RepID=UPI003799E514